MLIVFLNMFDDRTKGLGVLTISANNGTNPDGFGWEMIGSGLNTGGRWRWENYKNQYSINLIEHPNYDDDFGFGMISAKNWNIPPNASGFPPLPWFSYLGTHSGEGTIFFHLDKGLGQFNWSLRRLKSV